MNESTDAWPPFLREALGAPYPDEREPQAGAADWGEGASGPCTVEDAEALLVELEGPPDRGGAAPPAEVGARLLERVAEAPFKYAPFYDRVAEMLQVGEAAVEELLDHQGFKRAPFPGIRYKEAEAARVPEGTAASVVWLAPGTTYPRHRHEHHERLLVIEGGYTDDEGRSYAAGDLHEMTPGSEHGFTADPGGPCIAVAVADRRLQLSNPVLRFLARLIGR